MTSNPNLSDIQGFVRLFIDQAKQITDLVEEMHAAIAYPFFRPSPPERTRGITGLVYRSLHHTYRMVDAGMNVTLSQVLPLVSTPPSTPQREALLAIVNGIKGDYLAATRNPLAIEMSLRSAGYALPLEKASIQAALPSVSGKILILVHGLCMNDLQWSRHGHDHGASLAAALGYTPVYLHYNTGRHISTNGQQFAQLLENLVNEWPQPIESLVIIGHSMGGLVARSAVYYGTGWLQYLKKIISLGTPHHGAPLERAGAWTQVQLKVSSYTAPFRRLGMNRSAGITDLRYGNLRDEDWVGRDRFAHEEDRRHHIPLPEDVRCYAMAATLGSRIGDPHDWLLGDGLVPLNSALGIDPNPQRHLSFPPSRQWIGYQMDHLALLSRSEVYEQLRTWVAEE